MIYTEMLPSTCQLHGNIVCQYNSMACNSIIAHSILLLLTLPLGEKGCSKPPAAPEPPDPCVVRCCVKRRTDIVFCSSNAVPVLLRRRDGQLLAEILKLMQTGNEQ